MPTKWNPCCISPDAGPVVSVGWCGSGFRKATMIKTERNFSEGGRLEDLVEDLEEIYCYFLGRKKSNYFFTSHLYNFSILGHQIHVCIAG
jgi:hypothetical protein